LESALPAVSVVAQALVREVGAEQVKAAPEVVVLEADGLRACWGRIMFSAK
jgi:hypothetical protein